MAPLAAGCSDSKQALFHAGLDGARGPAGSQIPLSVMPQPRQHCGPGAVVVLLRRIATLARHFPHESHCGDPERCNTCSTVGRALAAMAQSLGERRYGGAACWYLHFHTVAKNKEKQQNGAIM